MGMQSVEGIRKSFLGALMGAVVLIGSPTIASANCPAEMEGTGADADNACQVTSWTQLQAIGTDATTLGLFYKLMNDLTAADSDYSAVGDNFIPIGDTTDRFAGHFDGNYKLIFSLVIDQSSNQNVGLFGAVAQDATLKKVGLVDVNVTGREFVGALIGENRGIITEVFSTGTVAATNGSAGGLIGHFDCSQGSPRPSLRDAYSLNQVSSTSRVGGLVGRVISSSCGTEAIQRTYTTGKVSTTSSNSNYLQSAIGDGSSRNIARSTWVDRLTATSTNYRGGAGAATTGTLKRQDSEIFQEISTFSVDAWDFDNVWAMVDTTDAEESNEKISYPYLKGFSYDALDATTPVNPIPGLSAKWTPISDWEDLANMTDDLAANYSLQNSLTPSSADYAQYAGPTANSGAGWMPLGTTSSTGYFTGRLKGNGFAIDGLTINTPSSSYVGMLVAVAGNGSVSDLTISNFDIEGSSFVGTLAAWLRDSASIENVLVTDGSVTSASWPAAGLVSQTTNTTGTSIIEEDQKTIRDSAVDDVTIKVTNPATTSQHIGGLVASSRSTLFERVYFNGTITAPAQIGGLIGQMRKSSLKNAYTTGSIVSTAGNCVNGVVAVADSAPVVIENVYSAMSISHQASPTSCLGGVIGSSNAISTQDKVKLDETTFFDLAQGGVVPGPITRGQGLTTSAMLTTATFTSAGWDFDNVWQQVEDTSYPVFKAAPIQNPAPTPTPITCPGTLSTASDGACLVTDWDDLAELSNSIFATFRLANDLDADSEGYSANWTPISEFAGTLDGNGKTISDLSITAAGNNVGLFGILAAGGLVKDLALVNVDLEMGTNIYGGTLAGTLRGTARNIYASGAIDHTGFQGVGGLVGMMQSSDQALLDGSFAEVDITSTGTTIGGLVGALTTGTVSNSYARSSIISAGATQGGLVGGFGGTILNSYSISSFSGTSSGRGGLTGATNATSGVTSSYWDNEVTGVTVDESKGLGAPRTTTEMKSQSTFAGWDFGSSSEAGIWSIVNEDVEVDGEAKKRVSYPYLTRLVALGFIDATDATVIGIETVTPPLELAATQPLTPAASASDVPPFTSIKVKFAETLATTISGTVTLKDGSGSSVGMTRSVSGDTLSIVPTASLQYDETYTINVPAGTLSASADNSKKNLTITWSFSTQSASVEGGDGCPGRMINVLDPKVDGELLCAVTDWGQLAAINSSTPLSDSDARTPLGLNYVLANDLTQETAGYEALVTSKSAGWTPIGTRAKPFHGNFDGMGYRIEGLKIDTSSFEPAGLFGRVANGVIKNLVLPQVQIEGKNSVGAVAGQLDQANGISGQPNRPLDAGLVGQTEAKIEKVFASGKVEATDGQQGGLIGIVYAKETDPVTLTEVGFIGDVLGGIGTSNLKVGGLIGSVERDGLTSNAGELVVNSAYFVGTVAGSDSLGGIIGDISTPVDAQVSEIYSSATILPPGTGRTRLGALIGAIRENGAGADPSVSVTGNIYWNNTGPEWETAGSGTHTAAALGTSSLPVIGSGSIVEITSEGDLLGVIAETTLSGFDFATPDPIWEAVTAVTEGSFSDLFPILANIDTLAQVEGLLGPRECSDDIANGYGVEASPCEISNWTELKAVNEFPGSFYKLTADIDKTSAGYSTEFEALDRFYGTFDGNDLTISDLVIRQTTISTSRPTGLFSSLGRTSPTTEKATVKDLTLANVDIQSAAYATGALAGLSVVALIDNVHVSGKVTGTGTSNERIGGLIGEVVRFYSDHTIQNSSSSATVTGRDMVGGLVGYRAGTIINSFATGNVTGQTQVGGLVGRAGDEEPDSITNSYATGNVTALGVAGGLVGDRVGQSSGSLTLERVFASGNVTTSGSRAGGLIGRFTLAGTLTATDAYATGDVTAENVVGGFMGEVGFNSTVTIDRAFSTGAVTRSGTAGDPITGGFLAADQSTATITNSYWDAERSGQSSSEGLADTAGLTTAEITGASAATSMAGLGFGSTDAWVTVVEGTTAGALSDGPPILKALPVPPQINAHGVGLGSLGISLTEPALSLFNDIISASNLNIALTSANAEALQAAATAAETIIGVASGTLPRSSLTVAMLTGIGITGVTADNIDGATIAVAAVSDPSTLVTVAAVQAVVTAGVTAYEAAAPVINEFVGGGSGTPTPPTPENYDDVGVKDVTNDNIGAINDLVKNSDIDSVDTEAFQHLVDAYNEIIDALGADPKRDPELTEEDYAALGFGEIVVSGDIADLFNSLLGQLDVATVEGWGTADPVTTYANLKARADLATKVIGFADEDAETVAELIQPDLEDLFVDNLLGDATQVSLFNQVVGASKPGDVSSVDKLQAIATAMGPILGGTATLENYNAVGLGLTNGMLPLFEEVLADRNESPVTYTALKEVAAAVSSLIDVAAGVGSKTPLTLATLESIGITLTDDITKAFPEIYLAIAEADPTTLTSLAVVRELINAAVTAANTFALTVVNGSLSGAYVSGSTVTLVANTAPDGQFFAGWTGATVADASAPVTTLTMPGQNTTVTATFEPIPEPDFTLTVNAGTGGGSYKAGRQITISANLPATGKIFDKWIGADGLIDNPSKSVATLVMPSANQTVTATYIDDPDQLFGLNVGVGIGSGEYKAGERIAIAADLPSDDQLFDRWSGDIEHLDNPANPNTRVTMPRSSVTVVALYADKPDPLYALSVNGGQGGGEFTAGSTVTISAGLPADGQMFDRWLGDVVHVANVNEANTEVIMPASAVRLRASYVPVPVSKYALTVEGGTGAGDYEAGDVITIAAALPPAGQVFDQWIGQTARVANVSQPNTTITMPTSAVTIRAAYKDKPVVRFGLSVGAGTGSGDYEQGQVVAIQANLPSAGEVFDRWVGQTDAVANINVPNTTLVMPGTDISLTATFKPDPESTPTLGRGRGRGRSLEGSKPGPFTGRAIVDDLVTEEVPAGTFVALTAPETPEIIVNNAPVDLYFDKWVGQTAYLNNVHATTAFMYMPNHDVTVLAQFRSIDGTITVTAAGTVLNLGSSVVTSDTELTPGSVVSVKAEAPASGFMFDKWIGQTAYLENVNVPETKLTVPGTSIEIQATYRLVPSTDTPVSVDGGTAVNRTPGTYITISAGEAGVGESFDLWGGQNAFVENVFDRATRMYVPVSSVSIAPVYKSAFGPGVDAEAATALLAFDGSQATPPSAATYTAAGITGVVSANVAVYNAALTALEPTQLSDIQAVVTAYNAVLTAANGNSASPASLTIANYAALGVTIASAEQLAVVNNAVGSQVASAVDSVTELDAIANIAARFLLVAAGQSVSEPLTPADFARLGFEGITAANIGEAVTALVQAVGEGTEPTDIATLQALFDELAPPPLPVPTLSFWAMLLMAGLMWLFMARRRSLFAE